MTRLVRIDSWNDHFRSLDTVQADQMPHPLNGKIGLVENVGLIRQPKDVGIVMDPLPRAWPIR